MSTSNLSIVSSIKTTKDAHIFIRGSNYVGLLRNLMLECENQENYNVMLKIFIEKIEKLIAKDQNSPAFIRMQKDQGIFDYS